MGVEGQDWSNLISLYLGDSSLDLIPPPPSTHPHIPKHNYLWALLMKTDQFLYRFTFKPWPWIPQGVNISILFFFLSSPNNICITSANSNFLRDWTLLGWVVIAAAKGVKKFDHVRAALICWFDCTKNDVDNFHLETGYSLLHTPQCQAFWNAIAAIPYH